MTDAAKIKLLNDAISEARFLIEQLGLDDDLPVDTGDLLETIKGVEAALSAVVRRGGV